ncbi:MAG: CoA-transferase [bacterium]
MREDFESVIEERFKRPPYGGPSKVTSLDEAVRRFVRPGMTVHTGITQCFSYAAIYELIRRFWGKDPGFTLISLSARIHGITMIRGGMLKKIVSTFCGDVYPSPGPNPVSQKAYADGTVEFENWSVLSLSLRLKAAAMGLSCVTTNSILGSGMERDNAGSFAVADDPFQPGGKVGLLKALVPDVSLVHGIAADEYGNTLFTPPYAEGLWGAMAAREGAIVTVERLVSSDFIRRHSYFCKLPGSYVRSVSIAPYGAHPGGVKSFFVEGVESYAEDYDFAEEFRNVSRDEKKLDGWIRRWILDCKDFGEYIGRVGTEKITYLKDKAREDAWEREIAMRLDDIEPGEKHNETEWMIVAAARLLKRKIRGNGYRNLLAGLGMSNLAAWMAACDLKREGVEISLIAEIGFVNYDPRPADPFIFNHANIPTCAMTTDAFTALGAIVGGADNRCIGALAAAQVDKFGNINSTMIPHKLFLAGSGGSNDVISGAAESLLVVTHAKDRLVEKVPYVTGPGARARTLVTTLGVFEKPEGAEPFALTGYMAAPGKSREECIEAIAANCGWKVTVAGEPEAIEPPAADELRLLRLFDPDRRFLDELDGE